jgi:hypothetical protein
MHEAVREQAQDGDCEQTEEVEGVVGQDPRGRDILQLRKAKQKRRAANKAARCSRKAD